MKTYFTVILALAALYLGWAMAGNSVTQTLNFQIGSFNEIAVSGDPDRFVIDRLNPGPFRTEITDSSTTYSITTNGENRKITMQLDQNMPQNTDLKVTLTPPPGCQGNLEVPLSANAVDVITGISHKVAANLGITYKFGADSKAGTLAPTTRVVTITICNGE